LRTNVGQALSPVNTAIPRYFLSFSASGFPWAPNLAVEDLVESNTTTVIVRLATLETRILEVEKRLNMPPAA
jgi:hypothetical protein